MTARRWAIAGLVIVLAAAIGVLARWHVAQQGTPVTAEAPAAVSEPAPKDAASTQKEPPSPAASRPTFDVVRVEPGGEALVAGRAAPDGTVELLANGKVIDRTRANEVGEFVMMPPPLVPGSHELVLRSADADSRQAVTVSVPEPGQGDVLVVVGEPGKASQVVQAGAPGTPSAGALSAVPGYVGTPAAEDTPLRIGAVEAGGGRLFVQGSGPPGAEAIIYLNEAPLAEATIGADGRWSLTVSKGLVKGDYRVRVDQTDGSGRVVARAEVPFTAEGPIATADAASRTAAPPAPQPAQTREPSASAGPDTRAEPPVTASARAGSPPTVPAPETPVPAYPPATASTDIAPPQAPAASGQTGAADAPSVASVRPAQGPTANPVVPQMNTVEVKRGDSLWQISREVYGEGIRYSTIYQANSDQIRDPNRIYPGQIFVMPGG